MTGTILELRAILHGRLIAVLLCLKTTAATEGFIKFRKQTIQLVHLRAALPMLRKALRKTTVIPQCFLTERWLLTFSKHLQRREIFLLCLLAEELLQNFFQHRLTVLIMSGRHGDELKMKCSLVMAGVKYAHLQTSGLPSASAVSPNQTTDIPL